MAHANAAVTPEQHDCIHARMIIAMGLAAIHATMKLTPMLAEGESPEKDQRLIDNMTINVESCLK